MAFTLNKILGTDTVGQAFVKTNQNIDKQIVSGNTDGQNLRLVSKDGTLESVNLSSVTLNFLPLSGGLMDGTLRIKNDSTGNDITIDGNSIKIFNDANNKTLTLSAVPTNNQTILFPDGAGTLALLSDIAGGSFLALTGGTVTGPTIFIDFTSPNNDYVEISGGSITFNNQDDQGNTKIINQVSGQSNTVILPRINGTLALLSDLTGFTTGATLSGDFLPLSGGTLTGDVIITNSNTLRIQDGSDVNSVKININSIDFRDDYNSVKTTLQYTPLLNSEAVVNMIDTLNDGYMVIAPTPSGQEGKPIIVNAGGNGWEYAADGFVIKTGDNITGTYNISDIGSGAAIIMSANTPSIELNGDTSASLRVFETGQLNSTTISPNEINFNREVLGLNRTLRIQPALTTTGNSVVTLLKPDGDGSSIIATVGAIAYKANQAIKVNNSGDGFDFAPLSGFVQNTGDTITGLYTINDGAVDGARIDMVGVAPIIYLEGDSPVVRLVGTDVVGKSQLTFNSLNFDNNDVGSLNSQISIQPSLLTTGTSTLTIIKLSGNTSGYIPTVEDISTRPNEFIKVNNAANGFTFGVLSGTGSVAVTSSAAGYTIVGSGATKVQSTGTGTINIISSITNNTLVYRTISAGSQMNITQTNGDIIIAANPSEGVLFNSLGNQSVSNSTTETSVIFSSVQGTTTLKASTATTAPQQTAGRRYRFTANGTLQSAASAGNLIAKMKIGSVLLASSTTAMHNSIPASTTLFIDCTFTVRTAGASSNIQSRGIMHLTHTNFVSNGSNSAPIATATATAIDTRTDKVFDFTLQFGTANASNTFTISEATLEYLDI